MLEIKALAKYYGAYKAVDDISFDVGDNQILGLLGRNGAGKTTLMNMIAGYLQCSSGTILLDGIDIHDEPEKLYGSIGYLPETAPLYMDMTVGEYLRFACGIRSVKKGEIAACAEEAMKLAGLSGVSGRLIGNLSKGYRQRVGIAQAVLGNPKVLMLDEPTEGLDPGQMMEFRSMIGKLKENHTIILSSHILKEIADICTRVVIISEGKKVAEGPLEELRAQNEGARKVILKIAGQKEKACSLLNGIAGVKSFELRELEGAMEFEVTASDGDIRPLLYEMACRGGLPLLELKQKEVSLEELFIDITARKREAG